MNCCKIKPIPNTDMVHLHKGSSINKYIDSLSSVTTLTFRCTEFIDTRRVPVQSAVERDEIPYPYKVHDTTLRSLLNITIKSTIVVRSRSRSCSGGNICGTTHAFRSDVNIAIVAIQNSF